ncbi:MAG: hypothetical protein JO022_19040 [Acidobacteriaceae bacterium]|nr:hypothetical protein [Acidobacteriaceae bacterium]
MSISGHRAPWFRVAALLLAGAVCGSADPAGNYSFEIVASTGQTSHGVTFGGYLQPGGINLFGWLSFAPSVTPTGSGEAVFLRGLTGLTKVRAAGDPLPGGAKFGYTLGPISMNIGGDTAFISTDLSVPLPLGLGAGVYRTVFDSPLVTPLVLPGVTRTPAGTVYQGAAFNAQLNDLYNTVFPGMICSTAATKVPAFLPNPCSQGQLAFGIYQADILGRITAIVEPGTAAPGGSTFDYAQVPFNNNLGDIAFDGHVYADPCNDSSGQQASRVFCDESVFLRNGRTGAIVSIARQGRPSPVAGQNYNYAFGPVLNNLGDLVFLGNLSQSGKNAVFLHSQGTTVVIARPGDALPGGHVMAQAGTFPHNAYVNDNRQVAFVATLDNGDQGLFVWSEGTVRLVAKTGTQLGGSTIANLDDFGAGAASTQLAINDRGQILFAANLASGVDALVLATPK